MLPFLRITVGVVALPNIGKTTLVNSLCNTLMRTGNFSGVTISKAEISVSHQYNGMNFLITFIDLPGVLGSDFAISEELLSSDKRESIDFLKNGKFDFILNPFNLHSENCHRNRDIYNSLCGILKPYKDEDKTRDTDDKDIGKGEQTKRQGGYSKQVERMQFNENIIPILNYYSNSSNSQKELSLKLEAYKGISLYVCDASSSISTKKLLDLISNKKYTSLSSEEVSNLNLEIAKIESEPSEGKGRGRDAKAEIGVQTGAKTDVKDDANSKAKTNINTNIEIETKTDIKPDTKVNFRTSVKIETKEGNTIPEYVIFPTEAYQSKLHSAKPCSGKENSTDTHSCKANLNEVNSTKESSTKESSTKESSTREDSIKESSTKAASAKEILNKESSSETYSSEESSADIQSCEVLSGEFNSWSLGADVYRGEEEFLRFIEGVIKTYPVRKYEKFFKKASIFLDYILTHSTYGIFAFAIFLFLIFTATFYVGNGLAGVIGNAFSVVSASIPISGNFFFGILLNFFAGIGVAISFVPVITVVSVGMSYIEKTGYITRICYLFNFVLEKFKLSSHCIIPIVLGASCSIAGYNATRIISSRRQRIMTCFAISFVPCSAKLTVFAIFAQSFFSPWVASLVIMLLYVFGIFIGILIANVSWAVVSFFERRKLRMSKNINPVGHSLKDSGAGNNTGGDEVSNMLELPPLSLPKTKEILLIVRRRIYFYLKEVAWIVALSSTVLFVLLSVQVRQVSSGNGLFGSSTEVVYFAQNFSATPDSQIDIDGSGIERGNIDKGDINNSIIAIIGKFIEPLFHFNGFDWRMIVALIAGLISKETTLSAIVMLNSSEFFQRSGNVGALVVDTFSASQALSFITFLFFYLPCVSATVTLAREVNNSKISNSLILLSLLLAYSFSVVAYMVSSVFV